MQNRVREPQPRSSSGCHQFDFRSPPRTACGAGGSDEGGPDRTLHSHLREENHQALVVGEFEVLGVKVMESRNVTLNQILLLVV